MIILDEIFSVAEKSIAAMRGKGWGSSTIEQEVNTSVSLLPNKSNYTIFDIGANQGKYIDAILKKKLSNIVIFAFEPSQYNIDLLKSKFPDSEIDPQKNSIDKINIFTCAISDKTEERILYSNELGSGLASIVKRDLSHFKINHEEFTQQVKTSTLADITKDLGITEIDILKMDIEGNELAGLHGAKNLFKNGKIKICQFEFGGANIDSRTYFRDFWLFFKEYSYSIFRISPIGLIKVNEYTEDLEYFRTTNYIATYDKK